jgi:lysophospholipase L1-like esterase
MPTPTTIGFQRMSRTVPGTPFRVCVLGDSITAFDWYQYLAAQCAAAQVADTPDPTGNFPYKKLASPTGPHVWFNSGIAGNDCTNFLQDTIAVRVTSFQPDLIIIECGINCQQHAQTPLGAGTTGIFTVDSVCNVNHPLIISQCQAQNPLAQVVWIGPLCNGEQWPDGTNAHDTGPNSVDAKDSINASACAAASVLYFSIRTAFFAFEQIWNPSNLFGGILTADGIHPTVVPTGGAPISGQQFMANQMFPSCVFS